MISLCAPIPEQQRKKRVARLLDNITSATDNRAIIAQVISLQSTMLVPVYHCSKCGNAEIRADLLVDVSRFSESV